MCLNRKAACTGSGCSATILIWTVQCKDVATGNACVESRDMTIKNEYQFCDDCKAKGKDKGGGQKILSRRNSPLRQSS